MGKWGIEWEYDGAQSTYSYLAPKNTKNTWDLYNQMSFSERRVDMVDLCILCLLN